MRVAGLNKEIYFWVECIFYPIKQLIVQVIGRYIVINIIFFTVLKPFLEIKNNACFMYESMLFERVRDVAEM